MRCVFLFLIFFDDFFFFINYKELCFKKKKKTVLFMIRILSVWNLAMSLDFTVMCSGLTITTTIVIAFEQGLFTLMCWHTVGLRHWKHQCHISLLFYNRIFVLKWNLYHFYNQNYKKRKTYSYSFGIGKWEPRLNQLRPIQEYQSPREIFLVFIILI